MFTGIIQDLGRLVASRDIGGDCRLTVATERMDLSSVRVGDSIAVSGVCLTALELEAGTFAADVSRETLARTGLGQLVPGARVNLELALTPSSPIGGHLVTGHVDGLARLVERHPEARSQRFLFEAPAEFSRFIAGKGSVALDGVSLTVNRVDGHRFDVNLIPHTLDQTTLDALRPGDVVNLEVDLMARYAARLLESGGSGGLSLEQLKEHGFA